MTLDINKKLSTGEVARLCGATTASVNNWIKGNKIKAYNTPGGQYRILVKDLINFIRENNMPVPEELKDFIKRSLLIIDSNNANIKVITKAASSIKIGLEVFSESNFYEGLLKAGNIKPDIMFLNTELINNKEVEKVYSTISSSKLLEKTNIYLIDNIYSIQDKIYIESGNILQYPLPMNKIKEIFNKVLNL
jgi:excisionase family DNA binding protein